MILTKFTESEKVIEKKLGEGVKKRGGWSLKLLSTHMTGLPDRICLMPGGVVFFVELKSTGKTPSKIQGIVHRKLREMGFSVYVVDTTEKLNEVLKIYTIIH